MKTYYSEKFNCLYRNNKNTIEYANIDNAGLVYDFAPVEFENLDSQTVFKIIEELKTFNLK